MADNGNGHKSLADVVEEKVFEGVTKDLKDLVHRDGMLAESIDKSSKQTLGVIQTMITAIDDDEDYRQIIKRARWRGQEHRDKYVKAINACIITGSKNALRHILDMITAESAGDNGVWAHEALEGITHSTITTRQELYNKGKSYDSYGSKNSPLS